MISVLLADDQDIIRDIFRHLIEKTDDMQIVATASNGQEAVEYAALQCPDVAIMDISMPVLDGIEATKRILVDCPECRVLIVSMHDTQDYIYRSSQTGALGYVLKDLASDDLVIAIRTLYQGARFFSTRIIEIANQYNWDRNA